MTRDAWQRLSEVLEAQHGVVATRQLAEIGMSRATFGRHVREHGWTPLGRGRWAAPGTRDTHERALAAAALSSVDGVVFTAATALHLIGALPARPERVHVLGSPDGHLDPRGGLCWHRGAPMAGDQTRLVRGYPCADPHRAFTDHARESNVPELVRIIAALDRKREASAATVAAHAEQRGPFHGAPRVRAAVAACGIELTHSRDEHLARNLLRDTDLPAPHPRPYSVEHDGELVGEVDLAWLPIRYGIEVDGPIHLLPEVIARDRMRDRKLRRILWVIDRFSSDEVKRDPRWFVAQVRAGIEAAASRGVPPWAG